MRGLYKVKQPFVVSLRKHRFASGTLVLSNHERTTLRQAQGERDDEYDDDEDEYEKEWCD